jgi:hypothetical protein
MNKLILFLSKNLSPETKAKIFLLVGTIVVDIVIHIIAAAILKFILRW